MPVTKFRVRKLLSTLSIILNRPYRGTNIETMVRNMYITSVYIDRYRKFKRVSLSPPFYLIAQQNRPMFGNDKCLIAGQRLPKTISPNINAW